MSKELFVSSTPHETKVAIVEDDLLAEVYMERENEYTLAGSIYKGRVTRVLPGMQSAFVEIGLERDAFLYVSDFMELEDQDDLDEVHTGRVLVESRPQPQRPDPSALLAAPAEIEEASPEESSEVSESPAPPSVREADGNHNGESRDARNWRGRRRRRGRRGPERPERSNERTASERTPERSPERGNERPSEPRSERGSERNYERPDRGNDRGNERSSESR